MLFLFGRQGSMLIHEGLTYDRVMSEQEDLDGLCHDRELVTGEIFKANAFYGNDFKTFL